MTPEGRVKQRVANFLREKGVWYFFPQSGGYGRSGVPDIIICAHGHFVAIECKAANGKSTPMQAAQQDALRHHGAVVYEVNPYNSAEILNGLESLFTIWSNNKQ